MPKVVRHDAITLNGEVKEEDFERFMKDELVPFFSKQYRGPTRASIADLKGQSLLKDAKDRRTYLWITKWDGSPESVRRPSFEHTRMIRIGETDAMLKKLKAFGKRTTEKIFSELLNIQVGTNK
jgi:hypothetical protein